MPISLGQPINVEGECADYETEYHDKEQYLVPVGKALYLGGQFVKTCRLGEFATGIHITLKEKGFYSNILGTSAVFSIYCDSVRFDKSNMEFTYYGRQRIERRSNILMRELVTAGQLKRVPRTENNPHGLLIVNWRTLLNKDIEQKTKATY